MSADVVEFNRSLAVGDVFWLDGNVDSHGQLEVGNGPFKVLYVARFDAPHSDTIDVIIASGRDKEIVQFKNTDQGPMLGLCRHRVSGEPPAERTPETVLRAMLKAYAGALPDAYLVFARAAPSSTRQMAAKQRQDFLERAVALLGFWTGDTILTGGPPVIFNNPLRVDYESRMSGTRPLDAPPLEL